MTKDKFMKRLEELLQGIPDKERKEILYDYEEHFLIGMENGKSEEEIAESLGTPKTIAKELKASYHITKAQSNVTASNVGRAVIATISLGFFNLVFVLGPFVAIVGVLIALWAVAFSLTVAPIALLFNFSNLVVFDNYIQQVFIAMTLIGLGVLLGIGMIYVTRWFMKGTLNYLQFNTKIIRGK